VFGGLFVPGVAGLMPPASAQGPGAASSQPALPVPEGLPRYDLDVRIDPANRLAQAREWVTFTNRSAAPVEELVFHVYPRYQVPESDKAVLSKTLEVLRLSPAEAMDQRGRRANVQAVRVRGQAVSVAFDDHDGTLMTVPLPEPLPPGETVTAEIEFAVELPDYWGRWGHHKGITYLLNWYPVLAFHDGDGWERTPFVPWHQPWHQEAGHYMVRVDLPAGQVVASSGRILHQEPAESGWRRVTIAAGPARDFALVCSDRFQTWERVVDGITVRVAAFAEHEANAQYVLDRACEVIPLYQQWFGPYPDDEFEIAASFFGWNGNECSGLVLLDDRVLRIPPFGQRYLDHLVTHETCHQWWWNVVGTDGYAETFMDEGLVNCFTALRLDAKYGRNAPLITWPRGLGWLPTIGREDLRLAGYYGWRARGHGGPVLQDLGQMRNLNNLFSLAYDRGGKVVEMIHNRLGPDRFFAFLRHIYRAYAWKTFHYDDLKRELAAFDPEGGWPAFLDGWLIDHKDTDWAVHRVSVGPPTPPFEEVRPVTIELRQSGAMIEPTVLLCRTGNGEIRVPIWPEQGDYEIDGARVRRAGNLWTVSLDAPGRPTQIEVDPDHALLDAVPDNNRWKPEVAWRLTPMVTPLDLAPQFQAYDRVSIVAGPFIDQYARGGLKVGLQRLERWQISGWVGAEPALREAIFGGEAARLHFPWPMASVGFFYEEGLFNFYNDRRHSGGRFFLRHRLLETSSFLVDDPGFIEVYYGLGNEFWPGDDGRPVNSYLGAVGARYRLSTLFPYWDPVRGQLIDVSAEYGNSLIGSSFDYARVTAEYGIVRQLPEGLGWLSHSKLAWRVYGGYGTPDSEPLFRLGGGRRLRALDLSADLGHAVWLNTVEWRFPIWRSIDRDLAYRVLSLRNLLGTVFYDGGQSYLNGRSYPYAQGLGLGLRLDVALFSFLERAHLRLDIAQPIGRGRSGGPTLWFGLNQSF
jgi:hypothetical protein